MQTLLEVLAEIRRLDDREALRFYNGFRTWKLTYRELYRQIGAFAAYLDRAGLHKGDRVIFWGENRPEWVSAFWGSVARGVQVVPVDYRSSLDLVAPHSARSARAPDRDGRRRAMRRHWTFRSFAITTVAGLPGQRTFRSLRNLARRHRRNRVHIRHHRRSHGRRTPS